MYLKKRRDKKKGLLSYHRKYFNNKYIYIYAILKTLTDSEIWTRCSADAQLVTRYYCNRKFSLNYMLYQNSKNMYLFYLCD